MLNRRFSRALLCSALLVGSQAWAATGQGEAPALKTMRPITLKLITPYNEKTFPPNYDPRDTKGVSNVINDGQTALILLDNRTQNCVTTAPETPGQAWDPGRTTAGAILDADKYVATKNVYPPTVNNLFPDIPMKNAVAKGAREVTVIVVDHFEPETIKFLDEKTKVEQDIPLRHGELVIAHLRSILSSAGFDRVTVRPNSLSISNGRRTINILKVQLQAGPYRVITSAMAQRMLNDTKVGALDYAVINMSFALMPCGLLADYRAWREQEERRDPEKLPRFVDYLVELGKRNNYTPAQLQKAISEVPADDPFMLWLHQMLDLAARSKRTLLAVASSGNFELPFETAPANDPRVIGVGGISWEALRRSDPNTPNKLAWSDVGDVYSVGEWYTLPLGTLQNYCSPQATCIVTDALTNKYANFGYKGTSFSAPSITAYFALRMGSNPCYGRTSASPLGFNLFKTAPPSGSFTPLNKLSPGKVFKSPLLNGTC